MMFMIMKYEWVMIQFEAIKNKTYSLLYKGFSQWEKSENGIIWWNCFVDYTKWWCVVY
jgi:hypothetical protein